MPLTTTQVRDTLEGNPTLNRREIPRAIKQENRLRLHSETALDSLTRENNPAILEFLRFVETLLPPDKFRMFKSLLRYPFPTVQFTDRIYTALSKIFDGRNPVFEYEFADEAYAADWDEYRGDRLKQPRFWKTNGFEQLKTGINSVMIVDLPEEQEGDLPEPYVYFLPLDKVIDFETSDDEVFDWIIFRIDAERIGVFDDETYKVYKTKRGANRIEGEPEKEVAHGLGYCPARFFWSTSISERNRIVKKHPLSNFIGGLDMLLFLIVGNDHLNLYARWPVSWVFAADCDFEIPDNGTYCQDGYLRKADGSYLEKAAGVPEVCPVCDERRLNGPGSLIEVDPPSADNEGTNLREPAGHVPIPKDSLEYNATDIERRKSDIYAAVTGYQGTPINNEAINETQILAAFESLETALEKTQTNFERAWSWSDSTICKLRYPEGTFVRASISLGTEHFLLSAVELLDLYEKAKKNGWTSATLDKLEDQYHETEFQNNPERLLRHRIISNLDPFRHRTTPEVKTLFDAGLVSRESFVLKANFSTYLSRFERENLPITEFAAPLAFNVKISRIKEALLAYVAEDLPEVEPEPDPAPAII